jgi:hypothetical protein
MQSVSDVEHVEGQQTDGRRGGPGSLSDALGETPTSSPAGFLGRS